MKKEYIHPEIKFYNIEPKAIVCLSLNPDESTGFMEAPIRGGFDDFTF